MVENDEHESLKQLEETSPLPDESSQRYDRVQETASFQEKEFSPFYPAPIHYAGFWMRFWAYLLDLIVIGSLERLLVKPIFRLLDLSLTEFNMFAPISIVSALVFYLYFVLMTKFFNQTLGKMVFGIKVVNLKGDKLTWGTILFREWIGRFISATVLVGYLIVAFLPKKQGLHDLFTDTTVVHAERY